MDHFTRFFDLGELVPQSLQDITGQGQVGPLGTWGVVGGVGEHYLLVVSGLTRLWAGFLLRSGLRSDQQAICFYFKLNSKI